MRIPRAAFCLAVAAIWSGCAGSKPDPLADEAVAVQLHDQALEGGYRLVATKELAELVRSQSDMVLLDVRPEREFQQAHILGSTNIPFPSAAMKEWDPNAMDGATSKEFAEQLSSDPEMRIVVYAEGIESDRSHWAATWAQKLSFRNVYRYAGGIEAWKAAGHETRSITDRP